MTTTLNTVARASVGAAQGTPWHRRLGVWLGVVAVGIAVSLPFLVSDYDLFNMSRVLALAIGVASLNLLVGYTGQLSIGHGAIFGIGGYAAVMCIARLGFPAPLALLCAIVLCGAFGVLLGIPAIRMGGFNLGLLTIVVAAVFPLLLYRFSDFTGGQTGVPLPSSALASPFEGLTDAQWGFLVVLGLTLLVLAGLRVAVGGRVGRAMAAVRTNQILAVSSGVRIDRLKFSTFVLSAAVAGFGGGLYALILGLAVPETYPVTLSMYLLMASVVGGSRSWVGSIIGAAFVVYLPTWTSQAIPGGGSPYIAQLAFAVVLGLCLIFAPRGLVGAVHSIAARARSIFTSAPPHTTQERN